MNPLLRYFISTLCNRRGSILDGNSCLIPKTIADECLNEEGISTPDTINDKTYFVVVDTEIEEYSHLSAEGVKMSILYTKDSWLKSLNHYTGLKVASEKSRANRELLAAARVVMAQAISEDELLGTMLGKEQIEIMVENIIKKRRFNEAAKWGVENLKEILE